MRPLDLQHKDDNMFHLFIAFNLFMHVQLADISPMIIIAYLQFLHTNKYSASAIANHLSAVKTKWALMGLLTHPFDDPRIKYFQNAIVLHRPFKAKLKKIIDIDTLQLLVRICDSTYMGQVFKAIYTLAFFSIFRISNLVPQNRKSYSPFHRLSRADVFFTPPGMPSIKMV